MNNINVAVIGATGMVGQMMLRVLEERNFPIGNLYLYASDVNAGTMLRYGDKSYEVARLDEANITGKDIRIALMAVEADVSRRFAPYLATMGATVIDNSSAFRMDDDVPLIIPEVNGKELGVSGGLIANPNCSTIAALLALAPLHRKFGLKRVVYSTYQAVSGAGRAGLRDLDDGTNNFFPCPITRNVIPMIGKVSTGGYTEEELKMINETKKILSRSIQVTATCVRVGVANGHCISINFELERTATTDQIAAELSKAEGVKLSDCPTPIEGSGSDYAYVGRIRRDMSQRNTFNMWVVADNIRKGAATNAVQIAELIAEEI